jgi:ribosomal-protein-alanine N-acetyltransferase
MDIRESITITPMTEEDVPAVHALESLCFTSPWDITAYYRELENPSAVYRVALYGERLLGFGGMWAVDGEAHIVTLAVQPEFRRSGVGGKLLTVLLDEAHRLDVHSVTLEVRVGNVAARALYTSFGFTPLATRRNYYPDNGEDALVMGLLLG